MKPEYRINRFFVCRKPVFSTMWITALLFVFLVGHASASNETTTNEEETLTEISYSENDMAVLNDIIEVNDLTQLCGKPLELGEQTWKNGRLVYLYLDQPDYSIKQLPDSFEQLTELKGLYLPTSGLL